MKKHTCEMKTEYPIKKPKLPLYKTCYIDIMMGGAIVMKCTVNYSITQDNVFPIHDIDICIKAPVRTLATKRTDSISFKVGMSCW